MRVAKQYGFTLIELMIVVTIIGILASLAFPAYQYYTIRARVTEGLTLAQAERVTIAENIVHAGGIIDATACNRVNAFALAAGRVTSLDCGGAGDGVLTVTMDASAQNVVVVLRPSMASPISPISWTCSTASDFRYVPAECRQ